MMTHKALVRKMLKRPAVKAEYDAQAEEFGLLDELLKARRRPAALPSGAFGAVSLRRCRDRPRGNNR